MTVTIIADSACDLPLSYYKENNVEFIPLQVLLNDENYLDLETIEPKKVYDAMRNGAVPKTSQASPQRMLDVFTKLAKEGKQAVYIAFSSQLSGTYQSAVLIANEVKEEYPDFELEIVDTKCASLGVGLVVMHAVKLAKQGATLAEIKENVLFTSTHMEHIFTVDDLTYLVRGGRVSKTAALIGGLLNIKPLLDVEDGKLIPLEKVHGKKKVLKRVLQLIKERGVDLSDQTIAISHGDDEATALEWKKAVQEEFGTKEVYINTVGAVIGSHSGPGTLAIFFLNNLPN